MSLRVRALALALRAFDVWLWARRTGGKLKRGLDVLTLRTGQVQVVPVSHGLELMDLLVDIGTKTVRVVTPLLHDADAHDTLLETWKHVVRGAVWDTTREASVSRAELVYRGADGLREHVDVAHELAACARSLVAGDWVSPYLLFSLRFPDSVYPRSIRLAATVHAGGRTLQVTCRNGQCVDSGIFFVARE